MPIQIPLAILLLSSSPSSSSPSSSACRDAETAVVVVTRVRQMYLCNDGQIERAFTVALGSGGVGKQRQGDGRTPLGRYGLGSPRASHGFHIFVPVQYPTPAQARMGFTGSAIGIHGPPHGWTMAQLASLVLQDWTAGCIAVETEEDIEVVAAWIRKHEVKNVRLES